MGGDLAGHARRGDHESGAVLGQQLTIDSWLGIEALEVAEGGQLDEVLVPSGVLGEQDEMVVRFHAGRRALAHASVAGGDVRFDPYDRLELGLLRLFLKLPRAVEIAVIRDRQCWLLELERPG